MEKRPICCCRRQSVVEREKIKREDREGSERLCRGGMMIRRCERKGAAVKGAVRGCAREDRRERERLIFGFRSMTGFVICI